MKLVWDQVGERLYETGTKKGVLFVQNNDGSYAKGVAWNGLTAVTESPSGAEATDLYADDMKYLSLRSAEEFGGTIEAYTYPDEWGQCDGTGTPVTGIHLGQQARKSFGMCYRTAIGNDTSGSDFGYKLHLVYGATASVSERAYATINDSPEAITFSWEFTTVPVEVEGWKPTALLTVDSTKVDATKLAQLEAMLYGTEGTVSYSTYTVTYTEFTGSAFVADTTYYEKEGNVYTPTEDTVYNDQKTYYTADAFSETVYTRSGTEGAYVYTPVGAGTVPVAGTTYYKKTETGGTDPQLPLPATVISMFRAS